MSYPNTYDSYTTKINKNASGWFIGPEYFNVPSTPPYEVYLDHVPKDAGTTSIGASGGAPWTPTTNYTLDLIYGKVTFILGGPVSAGAPVQATYNALGDDIMAEHMNDVQSAIVSIETELGTNPKASYLTVSDRLDNMNADIYASGINGQRITDNTVRAGALRSDIKGISWDLTKDVLTDITAHKINISNAHQASAIGASDPGTTLITTVQEHIDAKGSAFPTATNPHGMTLSDIGGGTIFGNTTFQNLFADRIFTRLIVASGVAVMEQAVIADAIYANTVTASGSLVSLDETVVDSLSYNSMLASGNLETASSGLYDIGSANTPFASGCFDSVSIGGGDVRVGQALGATGTFVSQDGKYIVVHKGIITDII